MIQGKSSVVWLVESLIKPLATVHMQSNREIILNINTEILSSEIKKCSECKKKLDPNAQLPKDQTLSCHICDKHFHKRCTDRRKLTRSNWQKDPWYCQSCILGINDHQPLADSGHPEATEVPIVNIGEIMNVTRDIPMDTIENQMAVNTQVVGNSSFTLNPGATTFLPIEPSSSAQISNVTPSVDPPRFPKGSTRQS